jgi:hypothetical protein
MNKAAHVFLGKYLCAYVKEEAGIMLDRESFLFGCVLPDLCLNFLIKPHVVENYSACLQGRIQNLLSIKQSSVLFGKDYSKNLGIICHYYTDFFCFPHRRDYAGDIVSHVQYEKDLYRYLQSEAVLQAEPMLMPQRRGEASEEMLLGSLKALQEMYLSQCPSFNNDITYCLKACTEALVRITGTSLIEHIDEYELCYPA